MTAKVFATADIQDAPAQLGISVWRNQDECASFPANVVDAHRKGDADGTALRRILLRGAQQIVFIAFCVWTVYAGFVVIGRAYA